MRDSSGKPGAVGNREDLERIARPEGARPKGLSDECLRRMLRECLRLVIQQRSSNNAVPTTQFQLRSRNKIFDFPITPFHRINSI